MSMGAEVASELMPCDVTDFLDKFSRYRGDLATVLVMALLKEPSATTAWAATGVPGRTHSVSGKAFADSLVDMLQQLHKTPPTTEMKQLNTQGDCSRCC